MEIIRPRPLSDELKLWRSLNFRMKLSVNDKKYYLYKEKGYIGELLFDEWLATLSNNFLIVNDLLIEYNYTHFQTDSFLVSQDTLYQFEVKNFEGDYFIDPTSKIWYTTDNNEKKNPLLQLERSESLMRQLIRQLGYSFSIVPLVIFVNPHFYLYQAPMNLPIIFQPQIKRFMTKLDSKPSFLTEKHFYFAKKIASLHVDESPYKYLPPYTYEQIRKGIMSTCCHLFYTEGDLQGDMLVCRKCGSWENVEAAVLHVIEEFTLLFPDINITVSSVAEWCQVVSSRKRIRKILLKNYNLVRYGKATYYVIP
jgi:hypothetical protein